MAAKLPLALFLDLSLGEPPQRFHPVCWMGKAVAAAESVILGGDGGPADADRDEAGAAAMRFAGAVTALALTVGTYGATRSLLRVLPPPLSAVTETALLVTSLAASSLQMAAQDVGLGLASGVEPGRQRVSHMVGRDTDGLDEQGVVRAAVESVAENTNDAVIAPMFYGFIGGAPLALAYKMVNTLDSMVGYRDRRHEDFGWAAARLDDLAGFLPARLTAIAVVAASPAAGTDAGGALSAWRSDAAAHRSPNAGVCESAFAGALGVRLGGGGVYGGRRIETPLMGRGNREPDRADIGRATRLMYMSAMLFCAAGTAVAWVIRRLGHHE